MLLQCINNIALQMQYDKIAAMLLQYIVLLGKCDKTLG